MQKISASYSYIGSMPLLQKRDQKFLGYKVSNSFQLFYNWLSSFAKYSETTYTLYFRQSGQIFHTHCRATPHTLVVHTPKAFRASHTNNRSLQLFKTIVLLPSTGLTYLLTVVEI